MVLGSQSGYVSDWESREPSHLTMGVLLGKQPQEAPYALGPLIMIWTPPFDSPREAEQHKSPCAGHPCVTSQTWNLERGLLELPSGGLRKLGTV